MKLTYEYIQTINFIALATAEATDDDNEIEGRIYNNRVEIYFTCDELKKILHILYVESKDKNKGNASTIIKEIIKEFSEYTIMVDAVFFLKSWYEKFGFTYEYDLDEMMCYRMTLKGYK